jgi:AcrR family transcriptional regulator
MSVRNNLMRQNIATAALPLFLERGIKSVTFRSVAEKVGLSTATIYHYFDNRDDLLRAVFSDWARRTTENIRIVVKSSDPPEQKLRRFIREHLSSILENPELFALSIRSEAELPVDVRTEFRSFKHETDLLLRGLIREGIEAGDFTPIDEKLAGFALIGMCNWLFMWFKPSGEFTPEIIAESFTRLFISGLKARPNGADPSLPQVSSNEYHLEAISFHVRELHRHLEKDSKPPQATTSADRAKRDRDKASRKKK